MIRPTLAAVEACWRTRTSYVKLRPLPDQDHRPDCETGFAWDACPRCARNIWMSFPVITLRQSSPLDEPGTSVPWISQRNLELMPPVIRLPGEVDLPAEVSSSGVSADQDRFALRL